jgi:TniQ
MTSRNLSLLAAQDDYTFLSDLLALSEEQIYCMTIHPLDVLSRHLLCFPPFQRGAQKPSPPTRSNGTPINRPTLSRQVYQFSCLTSGTTQICTLCLQEPVPYDRLYWKTKYLITCPEHRLLLQRRCSRCHSPILSTRLNPLICHLCQKPYQNTSLAIPEDASFLCQGDLLTLHALGVAPHSSADRGAHAHDRRQLLPDAQYLALMRALSLSMRPLQTADFQAFLPSPVVTLLTQSQSRPFTPQERLPPLHMATIHWLFGLSRQLHRLHL